MMIQKAVIKAHQYRNYPKVLHGLSHLQDQIWHHFMMMKRSQTGQQESIKYHHFAKEDNKVSPAHFFFNSQIPKISIASLGRRGGANAANGEVGTYKQWRKMG